MAQKSNVEGIIIDSISKQPVAFAHIYVKDSKIGTISNENGEFTISPAHLVHPIELIISHISYDTKSFILNDIRKNIRVLLHKNALVLGEVVVGVKGRYYAEKVKEILSQKEAKYGKAFYRQFTVSDTTTSEFIETFYDVSYNGSGISKLKINQARYARKKEGDFIFKNFPYLTFGFPIFSEVSSNIKIPFSTDFHKYQFEIDNRYFKNSEEYVRVNCIPSVITKASDTSEIWLNASFTYNVSREYLVDYSASVNHALGADEVRPLTQDSLLLSASNPEYKWYFSFSESEDNDINYILCDYIFNLKINDVEKNTTVKSKTVLYEKGLKKINGLKKPSLELEDLQSVAKTKYKKRFWKNNPIVKLTLQEEKVIQSFEEENAFGTYFK